MSEEFNPADKLMNLKGKSYLEVKWRVVWLREEAPDSQVRCEHIVLTDQLAVFKATVTRIMDGEVKGIGEGYGSEQPQHFPDYIEKAETKAIGRALAALGYGTAAAFDEDPQRIADAPVQPRQQPQRAQTPPRQATPASGPANAPQRPAPGPGLISEKQLKYLFGLAKDAGLSTEDLHAQMYARYRVAHIPALSKQQATDFIDKLKVNDLIDGEAPPPNGRVDPVEQAHRNGQAVMAGLPEEPAYLAGAPDPWTA